MPKTLGQSRQIDEYCHRVARDGLTVDVRTYEIVLSTGGRFEVCLQANGHAAVVDIPADAALELEQRIGQAVSAFATCARLRGSQTGR